MGHELGLQLAGDLSQHLVARAGAESVVDDAEAVDVEVDQGDAFPGGPGEHHVEFALEVIRVRQAREWILHVLSAQGLTEQVELVDVFEHQHGVGHAVGPAFDGGDGHAGAECAVLRVDDRESFLTRSSPRQRDLGQGCRECLRVARRGGK